jgi:hypothetical protein
MASGKNQAWRLCLIAAGIAAIGLQYVLTPYELSDISAWGWAAGFANGIWYYSDRLAGSKSAWILGVPVYPDSSDNEKLFGDVFAFVVMLMCAYYMFAENLR